MNRVENILPRLAVALALILAIATGLILLGQREVGSNPSATNTKESGMAAVVELLRRSGYKVKLDRSIRPRLREGTVPVMVKSVYWNQESAEQQELEENYLEFIKKGGRGIRVWINDTLTDQDFAALKTETFTSRMTGAKYQILAEPAPGPGMWEQTLPHFKARPGELPLITGKSTDFAFARPYYKGIALWIRQGHTGSNRMLAQHDHAAAWLESITRFVDKDQTLVILEAGTGNAEAPNHLRQIGAWADVARWQLFALIGLVLFTWSRRFGVPDREGLQARGAREVLDALSLVLMRAGRRDQALSMILNAGYDRIRAALRAPLTVKNEDLLPATTPEVVDAVARIRHMITVNPPAKTAVEAARALQIALDNLEQQEKARHAPATR